MFDIGGWEFLLIAILGIIIIGPKELPGAIRTVTQFVRRARELARDFQSGLEDVAREAELDKLTDDVKEIADPGGEFRRSVEDTLDPEGEIRHAMDFDREWRDDDLEDFADAKDETNRILPPGAEASATPADGKTADVDTAAGKPGEAETTEEKPADKTGNA